MAHLANLQRVDSRSPVFKREDFHPFAKGQQRPMPRVSDPKELAREFGLRVD
jgi:hypothetical protein